MKKIHFSTKSIMLVLVTPIIYLIFIVILCTAIAKQEFPGIVISSVFLTLVSLGIIFGSMYGFKIDDKYIRIVSQQRIKKYAIDDIKRIDVAFTKDGKYYVVDAVVFLHNCETPTYYAWHSIRGGKGPRMRFNITDENIGRYIDLMSSHDKFNIEIKTNR